MTCTWLPGGFSSWMPLPSPVGTGLTSKAVPENHCPPGFLQTLNFFFIIITLCTLLSVKIYGAPSWEVQRKGFGGYFTLGSQVLIPVISCSGFHRKFLLRTPTLSDKASSSALNSLGRTRGGQSVEGRHLSEMEEREKFPEQKIWP